MTLGGVQRPTSMRTGKGNHLAMASASFEIPREKNNDLILRKCLGALLRVLLGLSGSSHSAARSLCAVSCLRGPHPPRPCRGQRGACLGCGCGRADAAVERLLQSTCMGMTYANPVVYAALSLHEPKEHTNEGTRAAVGCCAGPNSHIRPPIYFNFNFQHEPLHERERENHGGGVKPKPSSLGSCNEGTVVVWVCFVPHDVCVLSF